jgi:alkyldihydroxyacetonephosphate synthase
VLAFAAAREIPVVPFGSGSSTNGSARALEGCIVLDTKRMRSIRKLDPSGLRVIAETGIRGLRLEQILNREGLTLGYFSSSAAMSTLGGWLACGGSGQMSTLYGDIEDMVLGLESASPRGIRRDFASRRAHPSAPSFTAALLGSEGTLAVLTAAELRLRRLPENRVFTSFRFPELSRGVEAIRQIVRSGLKPSVVRLYDPLDAMLGFPALGPKALPENERWLDRVARFAGQVDFSYPIGRSTDWVDALRDRGLGAVFRSSPSVNRLFRSIASDSLLILGFEGHPAIVSSECRSAKELCVLQGGMDAGPAPGASWFSRRNKTPFRQSKLFKAGLFVDTIEVCSTWDRLLPIYHAVLKTIGHHALVMAYFSRAYGEGCSICFTFLAPASTPDALDVYDSVWKDVLAEVVEMRGVLSRHHGAEFPDGQSLARTYGTGAARMLESVKACFDPSMVLSPGKIYPSRSESVHERSPSDSLDTAGEQSHMVRRRVLFARDVASAIGAQNVLVSGGRMRVRPPDEGSLAAVLRVATRRRVQVTSEQAYGRRKRGAAIIDFGRLNSVLRLSSNAGLVEVEAGLRVDRLQEMLEQQALTLGPIHPRARHRSIGAAVAKGLFLRRGIALGSHHDGVMAIRALLSDGTSVETCTLPKRSSGTDVRSLFVGFGGRLGVLTRVVVSVAPRSPYRTRFRIAFPHVEAAMAAARELLRQGVRPLRAEIIRGHGGPPCLSLVCVAHHADVLASQRAMVESVIERFCGRDGAEPVARLSTHYPSQVEVDCSWEQAFRCVVEVPGQLILDFLTQDSVCLVIPVADRSRQELIRTTVRLGGRVVAGGLDGGPDGVDDGPVAMTSDEGTKNLGSSAYGDVLSQLTRRFDPSGTLERG